MTILEIPVTHFSRCVILSEHLTEKIKDMDVVRLSHHDTLFFHLCCCRQNNRLHQKKLDNELTETVAIALHDSLSNFIQPNVKTVGAYLNTLHREKLNEAIWWECREFHRNDPKCELQAKQVIEVFCRRHKIELDMAVNYDTLYKSWTRYRRELERRNEMQKKAPKTLAKVTQKMWRTVQPNCHFCKRSSEELDPIVSHFFDLHKTRLFTTACRKSEHKHRLAQLQVYVYYTLGAWRMEDIARHFSLPTRAAYRAATSFRQLLHRHKLTIDANIVSPYNNVEK